MIASFRAPHNSPYSGSGVTAVLGPTNTGKTFLAIERMVAHSSGVIGLPLRLLAREVYQKVVDRVGVSNVALITGEEKIKPKHARFHVCTVEAMPRRTDAAFVAIDEVQLAGDLERGHVFTDRILHTRGHSETLLLGAGSMRGVLERLLPGIQVITRPRMSQLLYAGQKKTTRLPRRSAIVAFSADEVYSIAELIRRQRGGAAVVMGALSPRTRNAQVQLYQSGDVDFLVATDAIGMGLNLDVDHVAFAQDWKYDGFQYRQLTPAELGQIAGRAGRHLRDGTFGVTGRVDPFPDEMVEALEAHAFPPVRVLQWRSDQLDFGSIERLKASLDVLPDAPELTRALPAVDARALDFLSRDPFVIDRATNAKRVETLWEACKLPDYRRIAPAQHAEIIASVFGDLVGRGHVAEDYMAAQVLRADRVEGDIDTLSRRIAEIRTWTYISHHPGWLADPSHWQEKTRDIEDRLSDALHERLTKRFVDRRTSVLMKRLRENASMEAEIGVDGKVLVEGHHVGELQGFRFSPDTKADGPDAKAVRLAAQKALAGEFESRAERFSNAPNGDLALGQDGLLRWLGAPVASLTSGEDALSPRVVLLADEQLTGPARDKVAARAERFVTYQVSTVLKPLMDLKSAEGLDGTARGIAYRLVENFGLIQRRDISEEVRSLDQDARAALRRHGVRFGAYHIFVPALVKPAPANLLTLLWAIAKDGRDKPGFGDVTHLLSTGRTSAVADPAFDPIFYALAGYRLLGRRAVRIDILERLADLIRPALAWKPGTSKRPEGGFNGSQFLVTPAMMSILGATADDMEEILRGLGYRSQGIDAKDIEKTIARQEAEAAEAQAAKAAAAEAAAAEAARGVLAPADALASADGLAPEPKSDATTDSATTDDALTAAVAEAADGVLAPGLDAPASEDAASTAAESEPASEVVGEPAVSEGPIVEAPPEDAAKDAVEDDVQPDAPVDADASVETSATTEPETATEEVGSADASPADGAVVSGDAVPSSEAPAPAEPAAPAEIKIVQVWRPQRHEGRGGPREGRAGERPGGRHQRGGGRPQTGRDGQRPAGGEAVAPAEAVASRPGRPEGERSGGRPFRQGGGGKGPGGERDRGPRNFGGKGGGEGAGGSKDNRDGRENRRDGFGGDKRGPRPDKAPGAGEPRRFETSKAPARIDPDSPFAKLAALKDKLGK
ncbi:helicase [Aureimonas sp. Leaf454]|uniref:helicase-related protein n=1 Tax=Aureimonas sp. Leaf454 TaxID=1736381 RepID=UPI0006F3C04D|nr:helicase-related protein [Aureimonas sp. Leaf454]KQT47437.1 helicase [Aureimonas sp. Leaf454]